MDSPWSLLYSWELEVLDLTHMVMVIQKQLKRTSFILTKKLLFQQFGQKNQSKASQGLTMVTALLLGV